MSTTSKLSKLSPPYESFYWSDSPEPHAKRRTAILAKHPEIKQLMGVCPALKYVLTVLVLTQLFVATIAHRFSWPLYLLVLVLFGATTNHYFMMGIHELSHNICFHRPLANKLFSIFVNLPILFPYAITFRFYHSLHHKYQGEDGIDVDLPTEIEGKIFQSMARKILFFLTQVFFYVFRPVIIYPKKQSWLEIVQTAMGYGFSVVWYYYWGLSGLLYLLSSTLVGTTIHPTAAHFFAEHYVFVEGYETYSYYGPLNWLTINVGHHNEHHDFPSIAGFRLPMVKKIAPEFYETIPQHKSWVGVQWQFILNPKLTAFCRVKRKLLTNDDKKKLQ